VDYDYIGPPVDDPATLARVPRDLRAVLEQRNGFVAFGGGLHVRGVCTEPRWHSLGYWWTSDDALHRQFTPVRPDDVPFAEDALGDQFLLRDGEVHRLVGESAELQALGMGAGGFLDAAERDPEGFLMLDLLNAFRAQGGRLAPGQLLSVYPPFVAVESQNGVSMQPVPAGERIGALAALARRVAELPDGVRLRITTTD
jgi:hypothetical protein